MTPTPTLTATAHVVHNLGLAAGFGGALFGQLALNPAVKTVKDRTERGEVVDAAWSGFNVVNGLALGGAAITWLVGRYMVSGREIDRAARGLVLAKDISLGATILSGLVGMVGNMYLRRQEALGGVPMESGNQPSIEASQEVAGVQRTVNIAGVVNLISAASTIGLTAWLDTKSGASHKWNLLTRILP